MCDWLMIPNVDIMDMNMNIRIDTLRTSTQLELLCRIYISCLSASSSAIIVKLGLEVVERVNVLRPSGLHWHCPGTTFMKDAIGVHVRYGRQPSDQCTHLL
jgi:hypothetical protein